MLSSQTPPFRGVSRPGSSITLLPLALLLACSFSFFLHNLLTTPTHQVGYRTIHTKPLIDETNFLLRPRLDPWFSPPSNSSWTLTTPGIVLKIRRSAYTNVSMSLIDHSIDMFQLLFSTRDSNNLPSWAVTTIFIPESHTRCLPTNTTLPNLQIGAEGCSKNIASYLIPYDTASPDATPSYLLQWGEPYGEISELLSRGWIVNIPDYEGPLASYCSGLQAGHATLDSVRAVLSVADEFGVDRNQSKVVLWGYSGGALATEFSAELVGSYAPDLVSGEEGRMVGIAQGGVAPDIMSVGRSMNERETAGLLVAGIVGITSQHEQARKYLLSRLKTEGPFNVTGFMNATNNSGAMALDLYKNQDIYAYFLGGKADLDVEIFEDMYENDAMMGKHGTPSIPMFVYQVVGDEITNISKTDELVKGFCEKGANMVYHRNRVGGHNAELWQGRHRALDFMSAVLEGEGRMEVPEKGCLVKNVTVDVKVRKAANGTILVKELRHDETIVSGWDWLS